MPPPPRRTALPRGSVLIALMVTLLAPSLFAVRGQEAATPTAVRLVVAASTPIFADIVANVGGDQTEVWSVIPSGADPHTWEASPREMARLTESDAFVFMGANLEPFIEDGAWRRAAQEAALPQLRLAERLDLIAVDRVVDHGDHVHDLRGGDPHVWLDPLKTIEMVTAVEAFLTGLDPTSADHYSANADAYSSQLVDLDAAYRAALEPIPSRRRKLVVFHDAFTYFAARYGFEIVGVVLKNPDAEPSPRDIVGLKETIAEAEVAVVFKEPQVNAAVLDQLAAEMGVEVGELMTDTFTADVDSYLELMRFNLDSLTEHLAVAD